MHNDLRKGFQLSPQQRYVWSLQRQDSLAYRVECTVLIEGKLNAEYMEQALHSVVERHSILRTTFQVQPGIAVPFQCIADQGVASYREISLTDCSGDPEALIEA